MILASGISDSKLSSVFRENITDLESWDCFAAEVSRLTSFLELLLKQLPMLF